MFVCACVRVCMHVLYVESKCAGIPGSLWAGS